MNGQLEALCLLSSMQYELALGKLARHDQKLSALEYEVSELRARMGKATGIDQDGAFHAVMTTGYFDKWQGWAEHRLSELNTALALARAERESLMTETRIAFGRKSVSDNLLDQEKTDKRHRARARFERVTSER